MRYSYLILKFKVCLAPTMETIGLILSRIHVTQSQSDPPKPIEYV